MRRRFFIMILILALLVGPVHGAEDYIKWVDFNVSMKPWIRLWLWISGPRSRICL